jgi:phosphatidylglycerophosphatase C
VTNQSAPDAASAATTPAGPRTVAAFDFDGTLTSGGSVLPFLVAIQGFWPVFRAVAALSPKLLRSALMGGAAADSAKEQLFTRLLGGLSVQVVDERSVTFAERHLARHLRQDALVRLRWHQRQGHHVVIVSASPECYVRQAGEQLGVEVICASCAPPIMASTPGSWARWDACGSSPGWPTWSGSPRRAVSPG